MPQQLFTNQASTLLAIDILAADVSLTVAAGEGVKFPNPSGGDWFTVTIQVGLNFEIVKVTARSGDVFTIVRAQDGTLAQDWSAGATIELRLHAEWLGKVHTTDSLPTATIGDVVGPASAVDTNIAVYDLASGKLIKDGGQTIPQVIAAGAAAAPQGDVVGPASAVDTNIAVYDLASGKLIKDGGQTIPQVIAAGAAAAPQGDVVGPASATDGRVVAFDGTTGKLIKQDTRLAADLIAGPASVTDEHIPLFDGTTGKLLKSAGVLLSSKAGVVRGTYEVVLSFGGGSTGIVYVARTLRYTRIDDLVFIAGKFQISDSGTSTGNMRMTLPFTSHATDVSNGGLIIGGAFGMAGLTSPPTSLTQSNSNITEFLDWGATGHAALTDANITDTFQCWLSGWYRAATSV